MPVYEFLCKVCQKEKQFSLPVTAEKPTVCPDCGSPLYRNWSIAGVIYNGDGFTLGNRGRNDAGEPIVERKN